MNLTSTIFKRLLKRKLATALLITVSLAAFATLGDGGKKGTTTPVSVNTLGQRNFSLKSTHNYRGNNLFSNENGQKYIILNTTVTYQKGNATYIVPLKKKVLLDKVKFSPVH
jgi:hypothetical protein